MPKRKQPKTFLILPGGDKIPILSMSLILINNQSPKSANKEFNKFLHTLQPSEKN